MFPRSNEPEGRAPGGGQFALWYRGKELCRFDRMAKARDHAEAIEGWEPEDEDTLYWRRRMVDGLFLIIRGDYLILPAGVKPPVLSRLTRKGDELCR
jgi:hypothetical protein